MVLSAQDNGMYRENGEGAVKQLTCNYCHSCFNRREHLDRHLYRHSRSRPFTCDVCAKSFSRRDTLKRHVVIHGADAARAFSISSARESKRNARACIKCSSSKQKCDGNLPCQRCEARGKACAYNELLATRSHHRPSVERVSSPQQDLVSVSNPKLDTLPQGPDSSLIPVAGGQVRSSEIRNGSCANVQDPTRDGNDINNPPQFETFESSNSTFSSSNNTFGLFPSLCIPDFYDFSIDPIDQFNLEALNSSQSGHCNIPFFQQLEYSPDLDYSYSVAESVARGAASGTLADTTLAGQTYYDASHADSYAQGGHDPLTSPNHNNLCTAKNDEISSEHFYHVPGVLQATYELTSSFWRLHCGDSFDVDSFPDLRQLNVLVQLYFEYFHPQTPIIHVPTFRPDKASLMLLTAVAAVGCHYSTMKKVRKLASSLHKVLRLALLEQQVKNVMNYDIQITQSLFLYSICMMMGGSKEYLMHFQCQRSFLVTMCRPFIAAHGSFFKNPKHENYHNHDPNDWKAWVREESIRRIIYAVWFLDCFNLIVLWDSSNLQSWVGEQSKEETLNCCTLQEFFTDHKAKSNLANFDGFTRSILLVSMYVEERSYLAMTASWVHCQAKHHSVLPHTASHEDDAFLRQGISVRQLDGEFEAFKLAVASSSGEEKVSERLYRRMYHFLLILRRVSLRTLLAACRWHTSEHAWKLAHNELFKWIEEEGKSARSTLVYAARLFRDIRTYGIVSPEDPFFLMVATLVIWIYAEHIHRSGDSQIETPQPIRLDQSQNHFETKEWIDHGHEKALHITGIGLLSDGTSASCTLKEVVRIVRSQCTWSGIGDSLVYNVPKMLDGLELSIRA
ncbi:hypothetical protein ACMFMG_006353 [Clarireedia jacksonii]